jgi:uncharacterized protein YrzB (UPF0473 family)
MDERDNIIVLNDEDGVSTEFEFLDLVELDGAEYVVLFPVEDAPDDPGEVVILKVESTEDPDEESYVGVEDQNVLDAVFEIFKEKFKDEFDFAEE